MSDLGELLRGRLEGHEAPVDPGVWEAIQARLALAVPDASGDDQLSELFQARFKDHEVNVDPGTWSAIQNKIAAPHAGGAAWTGWAAAIGGVLLVTGGVLWVRSGDEAEKAVQEVVEVRAPQSAEVATAPAEVVAEVPAEPLRGSQPNAQPAQESPIAAVIPSHEVLVEDVPVSERAERATAERIQPVDPVMSVRPVTEEPEVSLAAPSEGRAVVEKVIEDLSRAAEQEALREAEKPVPAPEQSVDPFLDDHLPMPALPKLYLPSTFTPNGDGLNDTYHIVGDGFEHIRVRVYSIRTNQQVFATNSGEAWDGTNQPDGHYVVAVEAITPDGRIVTESKVVWLVTAH